MHGLSPSPEDAMKRDQNAATEAKRDYADLHEHLDTLRGENLRETLERAAERL